MSEVQMIGGSCLLFFFAVMGSVVAIALRQRPVERLADHPMTLPTPSRRRIRQRRTQAEREAERALILAALLAGVEPAMIARLLRGHAGYNRRKVNTVRRLNEHRFRPIQPRRTPALEVAA